MLHRGLSPAAARPPGNKVQQERLGERGAGEGTLVVTFSWRRGGGTSQSAQTQTGPVRMKWCGKSGEGRAWVSLPCQYFLPSSALILESGGGKAAWSPCPDIMRLATRLRDPERSSMRMPGGSGNADGRRGSSDPSCAACGEYWVRTGASEVWRGAKQDTDAMLVQCAES